MDSFRTLVNVCFTTQYHFAEDIVLGLQRNIGWGFRVPLPKEPAQYIFVHVLMVLETLCFVKYVNEQSPKE
jgi:hypothetical protein